VPDPSDHSIEAANSAAGLLDRRFAVPDHVVHRAFAAETVVLNLKTGGYHGLNPVAGRMLEVMEETGSPREAISRVVAEWDVEQAQVESDAASLCAELLERGLIEPAGTRDD
jgi:Coenzyme PQQ synthesis protein D (PqqD)